MEDAPGDLRKPLSEEAEFRQTGGLQRRREPNGTSPTAVDSSAELMTVGDPSATSGRQLDTASDSVRPATSRTPLVTSGWRQQPGANEVNINDQAGMDEDFQRRMDRGRITRYHNHQIERYDTDKVVGPWVFALCFTAASALCRWTMVRDMFFVIGVFAASLSLQYALNWQVSDDDRARFKDIVMDFHTLASFLIGFFVSQCLSRWWSMRLNGIGGLWGNMDDICLLTACYFPKDTAEDREVREKVLRWLVLSHELIYKQVQEDSDLSDLERRGLLLEHEHRLIAPLASKSMVVVGWVTSYFGHLAFGDPTKGGSRLPLAVTVLPQIHRLCLQARDGLGTLYTYTDTQVPFRYVHLISLIVWVHNICQALNSSVVVKQALTNEGHGPSLFIEIVLLFFYPLVYLGLINAGASMLNPLLEKTDVDMPRGAFTYYMFLENRAFFKGSCEPTGPPWGEATTWDPAAVRQTAFAFHLPPTKAY